jgi:hypothetical protein
MEAKMRKLIALLFAIVTFGTASAALAQDVTVLYSNAATSTHLFRNASDEFVWDDLQLAGGGLLTGLTVVANNSRPTPQPGSIAVLEFRRFDNPNGGPIGTLLGTLTIDLTGEMLPSGDSTISVNDLARFGVVLPQDRVATGLRFNDPTLSFGLITFDPPTVGASSPAAWVGTDPTPITCIGVDSRLVPCNFGFELRSGSTSVQIDVKPGEAGNSVNPRAAGVVWVAVLSNLAMAFDPLQVSVETVRVGPGYAVPEVAHARDVNRDGISDLVLRFRLRAVGLDCNSSQVALTGVTFDGRQVFGRDAVQMAGCRASRLRK